MGHDVVGHEVTVAKSLGQNVVVNGEEVLGQEDGSPLRIPALIAGTFFILDMLSSFHQFPFNLSSSVFYSPLLFLERFDRTIPASSPLFMGSVDCR